MRSKKTTVTLAFARKPITVPGRKVKVRGFEHLVFIAHRPVRMEMGKHVIERSGWTVTLAEVGLKVGAGPTLEDAILSTTRNLANNGGLDGLNKKLAAMGRADLVKEPRWKESLRVAAEMGAAERPKRQPAKVVQVTGQPDFLQTSEAAG